jgi:transcriptional regulator with XRE-family HTH domain
MGWALFRARAEPGARKDAGAKWDQQLALLFARSGWTQEQLADKEGKSRPYITQRLIFGRFPNVAMATSTEIPLSSLIERRFRDYWSRTEGTHARQRFAAVLKLMRSEATLRQPPVLKGLGKAIAEEFADGEWHKLETIVAASGKANKKCSPCFASGRSSPS